MKHKIALIPLVNRTFQQLLLPASTQILEVTETGFIPELHVLMPSEYSHYDEITIALFTAYDEPEDLTQFEYVCHYIRRLDQFAVHCFYQRRSLHEQHISHEVPNYESIH